MPSPDIPPTDSPASPNEASIPMPPSPAIEESTGAVRPATADLRPGISSWDNAFNQLQSRVSTLIESIEQQTQAALPPNVEPEPDEDRLDHAAQSLQVSR